MQGNELLPKIKAPETVFPEGEKSKRRSPSDVQNIPGSG